MPTTEKPDRPFKFEQQLAVSAGRRLGLRAPEDARTIVEGLRQWLTCLTPVLDDHEASLESDDCPLDEEERQDSRQVNFEAREAVARAAELCDAVIEGANTGLARKR